MVLKITNYYSSIKNMFNVDLRPINSINKFNKFEGIYIDRTLLTAILIRVFLT